MKRLSSILLLSLMLTLTAHAATTASGKGRIIEVVGHESEACALVRFESNATGAIQVFRIPDGGEQIFAVSMTALVSERDVQIFYDPAVTTGCGADPKVIYIKMF